MSVTRYPVQRMDRRAEPTSRGAWGELILAAAGLGLMARAGRTAEAGAEATNPVMT